MYRDSILVYCVHTSFIRKEWVVKTKDALDWLRAVCMPPPCPSFVVMSDVSMK